MLDGGILVDDVDGLESRDVHARAAAPIQRTGGEATARGATRRQARARSVAHRVACPRAASRARVAAAAPGRFVAGLTGSTMTIKLKIPSIHTYGLYRTPTPRSFAIGKRDGDLASRSPDLRSAADADVLARAIPRQPLQVADVSTSKEASPPTPEVSSAGNQGVKTPATSAAADKAVRTVEPAPDSPAKPQPPAQGGVTADLSQPSVALRLGPGADLGTQLQALMQEQALVQEALDEVTVWQDQDALVEDTQAWLAPQLAAIAGKDNGLGTALVIGEWHDKTDCLMVKVAAMATVKESGLGRATVLMEVPDTKALEYAERIEPLRESLRNPDSSDPGHLAKVDATLVDEVTRPSGNAPTGRSLAKGTLLAARQLGFDIGGFAELGKEVENQERESDMVDKIAERLKTSQGPVIVSAGRYHTPALVDGLKDKANVVAMASADGLFRQRNTRDHVRHYDLVRHPGIRKFRTDDALRTGKFTNLREFAAKAGVDLTQPPPDEAA
jgi:hypothetical protein